jgi:esterase/lipase
MDVSINEPQLIETEIKNEANKDLNDGVQTDKSSNLNQAPLTKSIEIIMKLINNIRQELKDLSTQIRTEVSQIQWATLEEFKSLSKASLKPVKFWQRPIFARIYFIDKDLDEIFQNIIKCSSIFYKHLKHKNKNKRILKKSTNKVILS